MKKYIVLLVSVLLPFMTFGQAQIDTKKVKIADFTQKITKVVLTGNQFHDASLKSEVTAKWTVSPFEFCTLSEFESLKGDENYYFLLTTKGQFKKENEPGLMFLTLVKGGKNSVNGIDEMLEIVTLPYASAEEPSGREMVFLPAFLDIIQSYTLDSMDKDVNAYVGLPNYSLNISKSGGMTIVFSESDLSGEVTSEVRNTFFDENILVLAEEDADEYLSPSINNTLVSYVVAPATPNPGSYCYKMLIDSQTNTLYYFRRHRISKKVGPGFLAEDIKRITAPRKK
jgi:hypothetical protein